MIKKDKHTGLWVATCDNCSGEYEEIEADDFKEAVKLLREKGWEIFRDSKYFWQHHCSDCG